MQLLQVDDLQTAREKLKKACERELLHKKIVRVEESLGSVIAEDVISSVQVPEFRRSTVDGYAVLASDTQGASETIPLLLEIIEEIEIGTIPQKVVKSGQCSYVPTGAMIPEGADAMIMVEYTEEFSEHEIAFYKGAPVGNSIIERGEELEIGDIIVPRGKKIRGQEIGALCACNIKEISVFEPMKIAIISTGNELLKQEDELIIPKVKDVNTYAIEGLAKSLGMEIVYKNLVQDNAEMIRNALEEAEKIANFVIISGGSSKGKKDMTEDLINKVSHNGVFTHGLALKPGKPTIIGWSNASNTLFLGLPGHPVAAMIVFRLLLEWLQEAVYGFTLSYPTQAYMETNLPTTGGRETCILVELILQDTENNGKFHYLARPILGKSGLINTLSRSYGYIKVEKNIEGVQAGELVYVFPV